MKLVNISDAKASLSRLVEEVLSGEKVVIGKAGKPLVELTIFRADKKPRKAGALKGKIWIAPDFDELPSDLAVAFGVKDR